MCSYPSQTTAFFFYLLKIGNPSGTPGRLSGESFPIFQSLVLIPQKPKCLHVTSAPAAAVLGAKKSCRSLPAAAFPWLGK